MIKILRLTRMAKLLRSIPELGIAAGSRFSWELLRNLVQDTI